MDGRNPIDARTIDACVNLNPVNAPGVLRLITPHQLKTVSAKGKTPQNLRWGMALGMGRTKHAASKR